MRIGRFAARWLGGSARLLVCSVLLVLTSCGGPAMGGTAPTPEAPGEPAPAVDISIVPSQDGCPSPGDQVDVVVRLVSREDRSGASLEVRVSDSLEVLQEGFRWKGDVHSGQAIEVPATVRVTEGEPVEIEAKLVFGPGSEYRALWAPCQGESSVPAPRCDEGTGLDSEPMPPLSVVLAVTPEAPTPGQQTTFAVTITAHEDIAGAHLSLDLPAEFITERALPTWDGTLAQGESVTFSFAATPRTAPNTIARATVRTSRGGEYWSTVAFGKSALPPQGPVLPRGQVPAAGPGDQQDHSKGVDEQAAPPGIQSALPPADLTLVSDPPHPQAGEVFTLSVYVLANQALVDANLELVLAPNVSLVSGELAWRGQLEAGESTVLSVAARREDGQPAQVDAYLTAAGGIEVTNDIWFGEPKEEGDADATAESDAAPTAGTLYLSGRFVYHENLTTTRGAYYARVEVYDDDGTGDDFVCYATTDGDGYWSCQGTASDPFDDTVELYARVHAYNSWYGSVRNSSDTEYRYKTTNRNANENGDTINFGSWLPPDPPDVSYAWDGAWHILKHVIYANELSDGGGGERPPKYDESHYLHAIWPDTDGDNSSEYGGWKIYIEGPGSTDPDEWDESVIMHEYGHYIMDHFADLDPPYVDYGPDGIHTWCSHETDETAYIEGWANYYQSAVKRYWGLADPHLYIESSWSENLETDQHSVSGTWDDAECAIAGILWDINDTSSDDQNGDSRGDTIGMAHNEIHGVFSFYDPAGTPVHPWTIHDFWTGWHARESWHQEVWAIYYEHGINKDSAIPGTPSLYTPGYGSAITDPTPWFDWSAVSDSGYSGVRYYQIMVDDVTSFTSPAINTTSTSSAYTAASSLGDDRWYWRVRARDWADNYGGWSSTWYFDLCAVLAVPTLYSPSNGSSTCDSTPTFDWGTVSGATSYRIQVDDSSGFGSPAIDVTTSSSIYTPGSGLSPGTYYWRVQARKSCGDSSWSSYRSFTIITTPSTPSLSQPENGGSTCDSTPTFDWGTVSGATSYRIQVDDSSGFGSPEIDATTSSSSYTSGTVLSPGTYYWRVQASNTCGSGSWSSHWSFTVITTPAAPLLDLPADGSTTCDSTPTFDWFPVSRAATYRIQVDDDSNFGSPEIDATTSSTDFTPASRLPPGTYYWRIQAANTCGYGLWSTRRSVTIIAPPASPGLSSPSDGGETCDATPAFDWVEVSGATGYQIQVDDDTAFGSPVIDAMISSSDYIPLSSLEPDLYYWRVRASNVCGWGSWSSPWSVTIISTPSAPSLSTPGYSSQTCDTTPTFTWIAVTWAAEYHIQVDDSAGFESPIIDTTTSSASYAPGTGLPPGTYHWRVKAANDCGDGGWSATGLFTVLGVPAAPSLTDPDHGSESCELRPTFGWTAMTWAEGYFIQVDDDAAFGSPEIDGATTSTLYRPVLALAPGTYRWRVKSGNTCGQSGWSSSREFTCLDCTYIYLPIVMRATP